MGRGPTRWGSQFTNWLDSCSESNQGRTASVAWTTATTLRGLGFRRQFLIRGFIADRGLGDRVFLLGKVSFPSLLSLYRQASYVLSASLHESNCLPVLEAAASGTPMIVSDISANRESAQIFQLRLFDPFDVERIATTLSEAWKHRHANQDAVYANREAARRLDWTAVAAMYLDQAERLMDARVRK